MRTESLLGSELLVELLGLVVLEGLVGKQEVGQVWKMDAKCSTPSGEEESATGLGMSP